MREQEEIAALEQSLKSLFDATTIAPDTKQLNRMARQSAQIPQELDGGLGAWTRQWLAYGVKGLGVVVVFLILLQPWSSQHVISKPVDFPTENQFGLGLENDLSSDAIDPGFGLIHGSEAVDEDILEDSFQALLEGRRRT